MLTPRNLLGLVALVGLTSAAPAAEPANEVEARKQKGVTVAQVNTGNRKLLSGPIANKAAFLKYNKPVPEHIMAAAATAATQQGTVAANPEQYDSEYL